jgi:hypothetical protein
METILACLALHRKWKPHGDRTLPVGQLTPVHLLLVGPLRVQPVFYTYTDQKENLIFHIYIYGNSEWSSCKVIYEEGLPNI